MEFLPIDSLDLDEWYGLSGEGNRGALMGSESYTDNIIPKMTSATAPSGVASASAELTAPYYAWKAFNHSIATEEDSWYNAYSTAAGQLQYQFPVAHTVTRYAISQVSGYGPFAPKSWTFKGSNDGSSWTTLDTQTNITDWTATRKVFDINNSTAYLYYRLDITASNSASYVSVAELEMMESPWGTS